MAPSAAALLTAWQNHPAASRAAVGRLIADQGVRCPLVSRGMIVPGTVEEVSALFSGPVELAPSSFTGLDDVADAFAGLDAQIPSGHVRVKMWADGVPGLPILDRADQGFCWEREWVLAGRFVGSVEVCSDEGFPVVIVTLESA